MVISFGVGVGMDRILKKMHYKYLSLFILTYPYINTNEIAMTKILAITLKTRWLCSFHWLRCWSE